MKLPNKIYYDCVTYKKSVRTCQTEDGRKVYQIRYDSDFGTCLISNTNFDLNMTEYELYRILKKAKIVS